MILPPADPAIPELRTALDGAAIGGALRAGIAELRAGDMELVACRPSYIRYKPGTSVLVQYALELRDGERLLETSMHGRFAGRRRADETWQRRSFRRLVERVAERDPHPPRQRALLVPDLGVVLQIHPVDRDLPELARATARRKATRLLREALGITDRSLKVTIVEPVRYRPGRKALLRYGLRGEAAPIWVKLYADGRARRVERIARRLAGAGVDTAPPLVRLPAIGAIAFRHVEGRRLADIDGDELVRMLPGVAASLARFHAGLRGASRLPPRPEEGILVERSAATLAQLVPSLAPAIARLASELRVALADVAPGRRTGPIHGDFYDDQVLVAPDGTPVLLDLDEVTMGDALSDVGNLLAHISVRAGDDVARAARAAVREGYRSSEVTRDAIDERAVLRFEAAAALHMAVGPFRRLEPDWPSRIERIVGIARARLEGSRDVPSMAVVVPPRTGTAVAPRLRTETGARADDPALPQLERLRDTAAMGEVIGDVLGRAVDVRTVRLLRHKLGRRATLRYDVTVPDRRTASASATRPTELRLYGKTYASDRAPRVHATLLAFHAAAQDGVLPLLPQPVAVVEDLHLVLQEEVPGTSVVPSLLVGDTKLAIGLAEALHALHSCGAALPRRHSLDLETAPLAGRVERLAAARPDLARAARRILREVIAAAATLPPWRSSPIHRDLYHDQVLVGDQGIAFIDLDDASLGEPAVDVANVVAHLTLLGLQDGGADGALADVAQAFVTRYRQLDAALDPATVRTLERATLLRLADIHQPRPGGDELAGRLLERADEVPARAA